MGILPTAEATMEDVGLMMAVSQPGTGIGGQSGSVMASGGEADGDAAGSQPGTGERG